MKALRVAAHILAAAFVLLYVVLAFLRLSYPFELEWQEGSMVDHVRRVMEGKPLYVPPSVEWVPAIYPPLYYYAAAGMSLLAGEGFLPLRLVSLLASLGCMGILFAFARRETGDARAGVLAAGLFAAVYQLGGAWYDLARVDSLFLLLLLLAVWRLRFAERRACLVAAALFAALAALTKQTALIAAPFLMIAAFAQHGRRGWFFAIALAVFAAVPYLLLDAFSEGWFGYYVFGVPAGHSLIPHAFAEFWLHDLLRPLGVAVLFGVIALSTVKSRAFLLWAGAGFLLAAWVPRVKDGNWVNDVLSAYAFLALLFGLALPVLREWTDELSKTARVAPAFLWAAVLVQFASLYYRPPEQLPTAADRAAGNMLLEKVRECPGEVWVAHHGYLGTLAGKRSYASALPIYDVLRAKDERAKTMLLDDVERAFTGRRFAAIFTDNDRFVKLNEYAEYERKAGVFSDPGVFWPVSGAPTRPLRVYVPRGAVSASREEKESDTER